MLTVVFGGASQGKWRYCLEHLGASPKRQMNAAQLSLPEPCPPPDGQEVWVLRHLEIWARACHERGGDPRSEIAAFLEAWRDRNLLIIFEDIGAGIVPLRAEDRSWREESGRLLQFIASEADWVWRVLAGCGQGLKQPEHACRERRPQDDVENGFHAKDRPWAELVNGACPEPGWTNHARAPRAILRLIRHGATAANLRGEYLGRRDDALAEEGRRAVLDKKETCRDILPIFTVAASPARRCLETAELLFPEFLPSLYPEFLERDLGALEGKRWEELQNDDAYRRWIDSEGRESLSGMEDLDAFRQRVQQGCSRLLTTLNGQRTVPAEIRIAAVLHGGVIMELCRHLLAESGREAVSLYDYRRLPAEYLDLVLLWRRERSTWVLEEIRDV